MKGSDRYRGVYLCRWTMCRACDGMGQEPFEVNGRWTHGICAVCSGHGTVVRGILGRVLEFVWGFYSPVQSACFGWRSYGFFEPGGALGMFLLTWRQTRRFRRLRRGP